jgi:hypothetical protein
MQNLLATLEPLCHQDRMRLMVESGKNPDVTVLNALEAGNVYERRLALTSCFSSRDSARVLRGLQDASGFVRGLAISIAPIVLSVTDVLSVLDLLPAKMRLVLLYAFERQKKVTPIADAYLERLVLAGNTREATAIIRFASAVAVQKHGAVMELAAPFEWARLARQHPSIVADWLEAEASALLEANPRLVWRVNAVLPHLALFSAARAMQLLRVVRRTTVLGRLHLQPLLAICPQEVAVLLLETDEAMNLELSAVAHRISLEQLLGLQTQHPRTLMQLENFMPRFSPATRASIFQAFRGTWADSQGFLSADTLRLLPQTLREREAKRHLEHPALSALPLQRVQYASLLGWDEAQTLLETSIKHPKPEYRIAAVHNQIRAARFERNYDKVLEFARYRKNEQDPVRLVILGAIAELPPAAWQATQLESLGQVLQDALNAADLSSGTALAAERIVIRLLPFHADWAAKWIGTLVKERGSINMYGIGRLISDAQARVIAKALLPVLKAWESRERDQQIINVFTQFGKRLRVLPEFLELAERLARQAQNYTAQSALWLLSRHDCKRFNQLVPELLERDKSWATVGAVFQHLHQRRQDLLTPFLGRIAYSGKFSTGKTRFVLPMVNDFYRWNPAQQDTFVQTLGEVARDSDRDIPAILRVLVQLANMPNASAQTIERLADLKNPRLAIRDAALRALGRLDEQRGLEPLLSALEDDRARVAIYALRRLLLKMMPVKAFEFLQNIKVERVTVAKEVLRLIGELRGETAFVFLLEMSKQTLHRDVRVALLRALWDYPEKPETWEIFQAAASDPDPAMSDGVIKIPIDRLSNLQQQKLIAVLVQLIQHPDPDVRSQTMQRCEFLPVNDQQKHLVQPLLNAMNSDIPNQITIATRAFFSTYTGTDTEIIRQTFGQLLSNRQALHQAVQAFLDLSDHNKQKQFQDCARAILTALKPDVLTLHLQTKIALLCLSHNEIADFMISLETRQQLHSDVYHVAINILNEGQNVQVTRSLAILEQRWREHPNEILRRLSLEVLLLSASNQYRNNAQWTPEKLALLELYRADRSSLVASAAQFTFPVLEVDD